MASFASDPIVVFGLDLAFATNDQSNFHLIRDLHEFCTNAIILLIIVHIFAALYHHFFSRDDLTIKIENARKIVKEKTSGYLGVRQERLVGLLIEAIKDQQKQIDELECQIEEIRNGSS